MTDNSQRPDRPDLPDRAVDPALDDLDVPTYQGDTASSRPSEPVSNPGSSLYERAGKAAPQSIPPTSRQPQSDRASKIPRASETPETSVFPPAAPIEASGRDSTYNDEDFAPTEAAWGSGATAAGASSTPTTVAPAAQPNAAAEQEAARPADSKAGRRGTMDFGLLILRLGLGVWMILESIATFFQLGNNTGLAGLEEEFAAYTAADALAIAVPTMQLAAGVFLVFGLITPLFSAVAIVVTGFMALHYVASSGAGIDVFSWPDAVWLPVILLIIAVALQFTGPGLYSLDFGRPWARRPLVSSWIFVVLALAGVAALWWFGTGINPFA